MHSIASAGNHCPDVQLYDSSWKFATIFDVPEPVPTLDTVQPLVIDWLFNNNGAAIIAFVANMPRIDKDKIVLFVMCLLFCLVSIVIASAAWRSSRLCRGFAAGFFTYWIASLRSQ